MSDKRVEVEVQKIHIKVDRLEGEFTLEQLRALRDCLDNLFGTQYPQYVFTGYQPEQSHGGFLPNTFYDHNTVYGSSSTSGKPTTTWSAAPYSSAAGDISDADSKTK